MNKRGTKVREYTNKLSIYETLGREQPYAIWQNGSVLRFEHSLKTAVKYCISHNGTEEKLVAQDL